MLWQACPGNHCLVVALILVQLLRPLSMDLWLDVWSLVQSCIKTCSRPNLVSKLFDRSTTSSESGTRAHPQNLCFPLLGGPLPATLGPSVDISQCQIMWWWCWRCCCPIVLLLMIVVKQCGGNVVDDDVGRSDTWHGWLSPRHLQYLNGSMFLFEWCSKSKVE